MYGYIYKTTNKLNNKIYIGQKKSSVFLYNEYLGSGVHLRRAVKKYGKDNFEVEMLAQAESRDELSELEIHYISLYDATNLEIGYNIAKGGIGGGEVYVNNGIENSFITMNRLDQYLNDGWVLGMLPGRKETNRSLTRGSSISKAMKNKKKSKKHIDNHSKSLKSAKRHWYTTGVVGENLSLKETDTIPEGYFRGRTVSDDFKTSCGVKNKGRTAWNKGLTKDTDERVMKYSKSLKNTTK